MELNKVEKKLIEYFEKYYENQENRIGLIYPSKTKNYFDFVSYRLSQNAFFSYVKPEEIFHREVGRFYETIPNIASNLQFLDSNKEIEWLSNIPFEEIDFLAFIHAVNCYYNLFAEWASIGNIMNKEKYSYLSTVEYAESLKVIFSIIPFSGKLTDSIKYYYDKASISKKSLGETYLFLKENPYFYLHLKKIDFKELEDHSTVKDCLLNDNERYALNYFLDFFKGKGQKAIILNQGGSQKVVLSAKVSRTYAFYDLLNEQLECENIQNILYGSNIMETEVIDLEGVHVEALLKALMFVYSYTNLVRIENYKIDAGDLNDKEQNSLYISSKILSPGFDRAIDKAIALKQEELQENIGIKEPELEELYLEFKENPRPKMKMIRQNKNGGTL